MPTFRQDNKLGDFVPLIKTPDIGDKQVTERKLADGSVTPSKLSTEIANMLSLLTTRISAFKVADNLSSLPTEKNTTGWLVDNHLYVYVGNGSTPESGMYQDCGELRGPQGIQGEQGLSGLNGKSAYDIWIEQPGNEGKSETDFLEFTRGSKGDKGDQGERGYDISNIEQIVRSAEDGGKNVIRVTRSDGWSKVFVILNGSKGSKGDKGTSIIKLEQTRKTTESSGLNTIEATLGDGTKESFEIYNGAKGEQGDKGEKGDKGDQGGIGPQGNSGITDASSKTLVNDAITGGETDFLSAEVGKLGILTYDCSKGGTITHATLQDAINSVPTTFQKVGLTITYKSGGTIYRYTLNSNAWSTDTNKWYSVEDKLSDLSADVAEVNDDVLNSIYKNGADADLDLADTKGNVLARFRYGHIKTKNFDSEDPMNVDALDDKSDADLDLADTKGNVLARFRYGHIKTKNFDSANINDNDIVFLNKDKESVLYAMAYNYPSYSIAPKPENKRSVIAWLSDIHGYEEQYKRFIEYINKYSDVIDLAVITGDINKLAPNDGGFDNTYKKYFKESKVPVILCLGNHDITDNPETGAILDTITELDDIYINPFKKSLGIVKGNGCYFYKDISVGKDNYRFISINEYEFPRLVADGSWKTIAYEDLPSYNASTTYAKGDKINLNNHSYKAIKTVVGVEPNRIYKYPPTRRFISQAQADWLVNVLNSTPEGFHIIFMTHQEIEPFERNHNSAFQCPNSRDDYAIGQNGNVILDIVEAFSKRQNINKTYKMTIPSADEVDGFDIVVESSFADAKAKVRCFLSGHSHCDEFGMTKSLSTSIPVLKITEGGTLWTTDNLIRLGSKSFDAFNILSFTDTSIRIMRVGCDVSSDLQDRKYELINK